MSAHALASQDVAAQAHGPMTLSARKKAQEATGAAASGDKFGAALAKSESETPATASAGSGADKLVSTAKGAPASDAYSASVASPSVQDFLPGGALWRQASGVSGSGRTAPPSTSDADADVAAAASPSSEKSTSLDDLATSLASSLASSVGQTAPAATGAHDFATAPAAGTASTASPPPLAKTPAGAKATPIADGVDAAAAAPSPSPEKVPVLDGLAKSLAASVGQAASGAAAGDDPSLAQRIHWKASTPSVSQPVSPTPSAKATAASKANPVPDMADAAAAVAAATAQAAVAVVPLATNLSAASSLPASSAESDSVARIGAALASIPGIPGIPGSESPRGVAGKSPAEAEISLATSDAAATSAVHVVAQQTWLPPVSPLYSPGLSRLAAAGRAGLEAPRAKAEAVEAAKTGASAAPTESAGLPRAAGADAASGSIFGSAMASGAASIVDEESGGGSPSAAASASRPEKAGAAPLAASPRRDLEITMAPKDLGGLEVRMKSAGDRLEIAFVADKGETARMISDKSATLQSQLHGAGLGLGGIEINSASRTDSIAAGVLPAGAGATTQDTASQPRGNSENAPQRQETSSRGRQEQNHETGEPTSEPRASGGDRGLYL